MGDRISGPQNWENCEPTRKEVWDRWETWDTELLTLTAISCTNFPAFLAARCTTWLPSMECGWMGVCAQAWLLHTFHFWACSLTTRRKRRWSHRKEGAWVHEWLLSPCRLKMICEVENQLLPHQVMEIWGFTYCIHWGFPGGSVIKNLPANAGASGDVGSIPGWGRSFGEGNGNPVQNSCWNNPMDRGGCWATVHGVSKSWTQLSNWACMHATAFTSINCQIIKWCDFYSIYTFPMTFMYIITGESLGDLCGFSIRNSCVSGENCFLPQRELAERTSFPLIPWPLKSPEKWWPCDQNSMRFAYKAYLASFRFLSDSPSPDLWWSHL